jgi:hypothetical protein
MERKYKVEPEEVPALLDALSAKMQRSEFITGKPVVHIATLYFDTPEFHFAKKASGNGSVSIKLRAKDYSYRVNGAVETSDFCWIEIKSRNGIATEKWRFPLGKGLVKGLVFDEDLKDPVAECAEENGADAAQALENYERFRSYLREFKIAPSSIATYSRHVFTLEEWDLRLTVDCNVRYFRAPKNPYSGKRVITAEDLGRPTGFENSAILETKSGDGLPGWVWQMLKGCKAAQEYSKFVGSSKPLMRKMDFH